MPKWRYRGRNWCARSRYIIVVEVRQRGIPDEEACHAQYHRQQIKLLLETTGLR